MVGKQQKKRSVWNCSQNDGNWSYSLEWTEWKMFPSIRKCNLFWNG